MNPKPNIRDICFIAVFASVIAVSAQISIPMPFGVPFTMQTLAIPLAGIILGAKRGALSVLAYILLGAAGIPVFTGFAGGIGVIFGKTGGYIISFPAMAICAGISSDWQDKIKNTPVKNAVLSAGLVSGAVINYICGMLWGKFILNCGLRDAFLWFVLPYIPTAVIKIILAGVLGAMTKNLLKKSGVLI